MRGKDIFFDDMRKGGKSGMYRSYFPAICSIFNLVGRLWPSPDYTPNKVIFRALAPPNTRDSK